jgi:hypothetical protein
MGERVGVRGGSNNTPDLYRSTEFVARSFSLCATVREGSSRGKKRSEFRFLKNS